MLVVSEVALVQAEGDALSIELEAALLAMDRSQAAEVFARARERLGTVRLADCVLAPALTRLGESWAEGGVALAQVYMAGRIAEGLVLALAEDRARRGPPIGVAVLGDYHALGARVVSSALICAGYDVRELGYGLTPGQIVERAIAAGVEILLISSLMLNHALRVRELLDELARAGHRSIRVGVGGAPFVHDPELWREVGAHAVGGSASDALRMVAEFTSEGA